MNEVRVYDAAGKLKQVISKQELIAISDDNLKSPQNRRVKPKPAPAPENKRN